MSTPEHIWTCSDIAAGRLAPYEPKISGNFELPMHVGKLIAYWDRSKFVTVDKAIHMRPDDYVVGVEYKGVYRAYPLWITDNYHMINDTIAGDAVLFSTCERCQSGSAFISQIDGKNVKFSAMGMYNASLTMVNRKQKRGEQHSLWLHYEGVAINGPLKGQFLEQIPTYHMTWEEWINLHPETDVMLAPEDPYHRDARHGHGREEIFSRPGMDPPLAKTVTGHFDHQYPENEIVLGINIDAGIRAYPLLEVKHEGGVVNDQLGDVPIIVFSGPQPEQVTMSAFIRNVKDRTLTFDCKPEGFRDRETQSLWDMEGRAISGELEGFQLQPLRWQYVRWHAWVYPHPGTQIYLSERPLPAYPEFPSYPQVNIFHDILDKLSSVESKLHFSHVIYNLSLPHEADAGICIHAGSDRLNLYRFTSEAAANDYVNLQGAWYCMPFDTKIARKRALTVNGFVVESDPTDQYAEPTQTVHYPDNQTPWSQLIQHSEWLQDLTDQNSDEQEAEGYFTSLVHFLKSNRYDVVEVAFLPHSQQRPGTISTIAATIEGDRFAIYRCENEKAAVAAADEVTHALQVGSWVFRSIPVLMYADPHYEMGQLPDIEIAWSKLLKKEVFRRHLIDFINNLKY
ncbi:MAG: DUF3179 domain-containing (seleno)protein [Planctomycetota bacterium]|jgi:hypothetical protein